MIRFSKLALLAAATAAFTFTGCGEDTTPSDASNVGSVTCVANDINYTSHIGLRTFTEVCTIKGQFQDQNVTLDATKLYQLDGEVVIGGDNANPANLIIPANTVLFGGFGDFILISRGSQINATGTSTNPIIMTSAEDIIGDANASSRGQWGGLAIAGNGQINKGTEEAFEFSSIGRTFGGNDDADNSGVVEYVV
ncbi:MAG: hypothetical protein OEW60_04030, partial [Thiovulaceae bacterium]|nr:hypothetical protein [Sulfurimonadaceae bacterium]